MTLLTYHSKYVVQSSTAISTTSTTLQDDSYASQTFYLDSTKTVLAIYVANNTVEAADVNSLTNAISIDGTDHSTANQAGAVSDYSACLSRNTCFWIGSLNAGTHTIKGRFAATLPGGTISVRNRTLLIYIFNGNEFTFVENNTQQSTTSETYVDDSYATATFTPTGACKALILYAANTAFNSSESFFGKKICIRVGSTDYTACEAHQSPIYLDCENSLCTAYALPLTATSTTVKGRFACVVSGSEPVTIDKHVLGVLLLDDSTTVDLSSSTTQVSNSSTTLANDTQATITRSASGELLVLAQATQKLDTSGSTDGNIYGISIDSTDVAHTRFAPCQQGCPFSGFVTYAQTVTSGSHTIYGRFAANVSGQTAKIDTRILIALWFSTSTPPTTLECASTMIGSGSLSTTATVIESAQTLSCASTISGSGNLTANNILYKLLSSILSGSGSSTSQARIYILITSTVSGSGSSTANNILLTFLQLASSLSGSGSSTANIIEFERLASSVSGSGTQTGNANLQKQISSSVSSSGSESANIIIFELLNSSVTGSGSQSGNSSLQKSVSSTISGSGSETATAFVYNIINSVVSGSGTQTGNGILYQFLSSILSGAGDETANITVLNFGAGVECSSTMIGSGSQSASSSVFDFVSSNISGSGTQTGNAKLNKIIGSVLSGSGSQSSSAVVSAYLSSSVSGSGSQTANDILYKFISSIISGSSEQSANAVVLNYGSGVECYSSVTGSGSQSANPLLYNYINSTVSGAGSETGNANLQKKIASSVSGSGSQTSRATLQKMIQSIIEGNGEYTSSVLTYEQLSSVLSGSGSSSANPTLTNYISSTVSGSGTQTASASLQEIISSILEGSGEYSADATIIIITHEDFKYPLTVVLNAKTRTATIIQNRRTVTFN
jgi:hypothetical protein